MTPGELDVRRRLLEEVERFPGLHLRELARQLGLSEALASYHVDLLQEQGLLRAESDEGFRRLFPAGRRGQPSAEDRRHLALLRQRVPLRIVLFLLERGRLTHPQLVEALALSKSTVSYQLQKLVEGGLVVHAGEAAGFGLKDAKGTERFLLKWRPTPDLIERFADIWESLYGRRRGR